MTEIVRVAIAKTTRKRIRQIASLTDETMYDVIERLAVAEQQRLQSKRGVVTEPWPVEGGHVPHDRHLPLE